ncbi:MAG: hypothetical protein AAGH78_04575, partial [Cyanobacteria bacterium P01_H01_bin.58]
MRHLLWIEGNTQSGKTTRLLSHLQTLADTHADTTSTGSVFLVFAANGDNRLVLADRLVAEVSTSVPLTTATPAGFVQNEVTLFWPLLVESLQLSPQFPIRLHPEKEQELATQLWQAELAPEGELAVAGWTVMQTVRRSLDFLQLSTAAGIPAEDLMTLLPQGIPPGVAKQTVWQAMGTAVVQWRDWCLSQGFLTYGIATELYWRYLLPHPTYREKFPQRFCGVLADDLDEYPGWFQQLLIDADALRLPTAITWNPYGKVRLGVGADPAALAPLREIATTVETVSLLPPTPLVATWADKLVNLILDPVTLPDADSGIDCLQATSRGELLRQTADAIAHAIQSDTVPPGEIAVIGPGFDAIARYTLAEILQKKGIP